MTFLFLIILIGILYYLSKPYLENPSFNNFSDFKNAYNKFSNKQKQREFNLDDAVFLISLLAKVAKSDGVISKEEANYISNMLDLICDDLGTRAHREYLKQVFNTQKNSPKNIFSLASEYKRHRNLSQSDCISVVIYMLNLAYIDGNFSQSERIMIADICDGFALDSSIKYSLFDRFEKEFSYYKRQASQNYQTQKDPYKVLGLSPNASWDEIRKEYRKLARKYHPDFLGTNADENVVQDATKKLQEINEAYEILKRKFEK